MASFQQPSADSSEPHMQRWIEQRWLVDNIIRANGADWDQPRTISYNVPCGVEANADFAAIRQRVQKFADLTPAFETAARRRETRAKEAEQNKQLVTARQNYFIAAVQYAASQWPFDDCSERNRALNQAKRDCYLAYARLAAHKIEPVAIPFKGGTLAGWWHLPPGSSGGKLPAIWWIPGMDGFKEANVAMYGDRWLMRGIAVLSLEGPGQYESRIMGTTVSVPNWSDAAKTVADWMLARPEVDANRLGIGGSSFGSFFGTIAAASEPRFKACAVTSTCLEPTCHTIFEEASPTFKKRFMWMSGYSDEASFDEFCKTLTWEGHVDKIRAPYLCVAGEADELSPLVHTERLLTTLKCPKQLVVYQDSRHSVGNVPSAHMGPAPTGLLADWMEARLSGQPFANERWYVEAGGRIVKTAY